MWGSVFSLLVVGFIALGAQANIFKEKLRYPSLPFNVGQCSALNYTDITDIRYVYLSYIFYFNKKLLSLF
jgi:hypothetical protein